MSVNKKKPQMYLVPVQVFHMFPVVALVLAPHMCLDLVSRMCLGEQDHCPPMVRIRQQLLSNLAVHFLVLPHKLPTMRSEMLH